MTTYQITDSIGGITLSNPDYGSPFTVTATGTVTGSLYNGIEASSDWAIANNGTVTGNFAGIQLDAGGSIANTGSVYASSDGIYFTDGGSVSNAASGTIAGGGYGIQAQPGSGAITVDNHGAISGIYGTGVYLNPNSPNSAVTNESDGTISGYQDGILTGDGSTIINMGRIDGEHAYGVEIGVRGATPPTDPAGTFITNASGATIAGYGAGIYGRPGEGAVTIANSGLISGNQGIDLFDYGTVINAGSIDGIALIGGGSVTNEASGTITGQYDGVALIQSGSVTNEASGAITGIHDGVYLKAGGNVTNEAFGTISGGHDGVYLGDVGTVINAGSISGDVELDAGGSVTNEAGGTISSGGVYLGGFGTVVNAGSISGEAGFGAGGTLINSGEIAGVYLIEGGSVTNALSASIDGYSYGVVDQHGNTTIINAGRINASAASGYGIGLRDGGSVTNEQTGTIGGGHIGVYLAGASATLENAGTIIGGTSHMGFFRANHAVFFYAAGANRLIIDAGAVFDGDVAARASASNTIELTSNATAGTISGLGVKYTGFQTVTIDSGATWTVGGTAAGFNGVTIEGFNTHDRLDLTDLGFDAGNSVTLASGDVLTITDGDGDVVDTLHLAGDFTDDTFKLLSDSHGGTFIEEEHAACYCRGTLIRTPDGEVPVENLRIGDAIVTADGEVLPLKWIGRRSYRDWLAVGNDNVQPIRFNAGSIADHVPARDLFVSPEHAMFLDGVLVPAGHLVNGTSILKVEGMEEIEYFHLEFDGHVVILAEGAAAESFVDDDSRMLFHNADEYRRLYPNERRGRHTAFCAPRVEDGAVLERLRDMLKNRASQLRPNGATALPPARRGYVDRATRAAIEGWALPGIGEPEGYRRSSANRPSA